MTRTGWVGEDPEPAAPAMPVTEMLLGMRQRGPGDTLAQAQARSRAADAREARDQAASAPDPDERAANLVTRGYTPGLLNELALRLGDATAELEAEREKLEKGKRRQEHLHRAQQAGQITVFDVARAQAQDFDEGDQATVERLQRRADGIRRQMAEAQEMIAPPQERAPDAFEAATRRAHQAFREATRAAWEAAQSGSARPAPRPFASVSRGAGRSEHTGPDCEICAAAREREAARDRAEFAAVYGEISR